MNKYIKNIAIFIGGYVVISYLAFGIQYLGYIFSLDNFFGSTFDPRYMLEVDNCDRRYNIDLIILNTLSFGIVQFFINKDLLKIEKRYVFYSYLVLMFTFLGRLFLPEDWGGCF